MTTANLPDLPPPTFPMVTLVITDNIAPVGPTPEQPVPPPQAITARWAVGSVHPYVPDANIVRMFIRTDAGAGVEVYSYSVDGQGRAAGMRDFIPVTRVRFVQEAMPIHIFADELETAEIENADAGDDDDDDAPELDEPGTGTTTTTGGAAQA